MLTLCLVHSATKTLNWLGIVLSFVAIIIHAYHLWCTLMHFFSSTICCMSTCLQEVHSDWWDLIGLKKSEDKLLGGRGRCHSQRDNAHHREQQGICCLLLNSFDFILDIW